MKYKLRGIVELLRPFTLLAPVIVSSSVMIASLIYSGNTDISYLTIVLTVIPASICFALLNGASNALNQSTDFKEDKLSKPYRPLPMGNITQNEARNISFILYVFAILLSLIINITFSWFVLLIAFFSITYSLPPRMKKFLFVNQLWVAVPRGFLGILGSWSVFGDPFQKLPLAIGFIAAIFLFGGTATKDILDAEADKKTGTKTLVNVLGIKKTALISFLFMASAFALIIPLIILKIIEFYLFPLTLLVVLSFLIFWLMIHDRKNEKHENTSSWTLMYATYFIYAVSFAIITISFA
ncbi:MAG: UbiA prenyltransferase family protein [Thermoplasmatales archaeon]|nr:MAG: UbiA prenyltransferase family protein [Thermoplasmatales archaeon]